MDNYAMLKLGYYIKFKWNYVSFLSW